MSYFASPTPFAALSHCFQGPYKLHIDQRRLLNLDIFFNCFQMPLLPNCYNPFLTTILDFSLMFKNILKRIEGKWSFFFDILVVILLFMLCLSFFLAGKKVLWIYLQVNRLENEGFYGGVRLVMAMCKVFYKYCKNNNIDLHEGLFTLSYDTNIPRQVITSLYRHACLRIMY